jgi:hypothetical protein
MEIDFVCMQENAQLVALLDVVERVGMLGCSVPSVVAFHAHFATFFLLL